MIQEQESTIRVDGHDLGVISFNPDAPGTPIILLHGITASIRFWTEDQVAPFGAHGPCYALSLPGHYPARFPRGLEETALTAEMIARVLAAAIRELVGEQPVLLVGHSTGGFAALDVAAHTPALARGVISISGFAHGRWTGVLGKYQGWVRSGLLGQWAFKSLFKSASLLPGMYRSASRWYVVEPRTLEAYPHFDAIVAASFPDYKQIDLNAMVTYFRRMPSIDISALLPRITVPTLALTGDSDPIVPPAQAHLIAERVPQADLAVLERVGHMPFYEDPTGYRQAIASWLERVLV